MKLPDTFTPDKSNINVVIETPAGNGNKYTYFPKKIFLTCQSTACKSEKIN